jgi:TRAP-type C4-dicarboxylate transport system substrate-binding protein
MSSTKRVSDAARAFGLAAALLAGAVAGAAAQDTKTFVMKLSTATLNDAQHEWMKRFAPAIEKNTNGRIKVEIYPASQLGTIPRQIEGTQLGSIQGWLGPPDFLVGLDQRFEVMSAPGLFQDDRHAFTIFDDAEFNKAFLSIGANKGLVGVGLFYTAPASFDMRAPVRRLADLRGKKIRVLASQFQTEPLARIGATGVPMTLGDVLPALQQGAIDGAYGGVSVFTALQYQDAAKYMLETRHAYLFSVAMLSKRWFDALPADLQSQVLATSNQITRENIPWSLDFVEQQRKVWVSKGGEMVSLPDEDLKELRQKVATVGDDIVKAKPELKPIYDMLVASAKRNAKP